MKRTLACLSFLAALSSSSLALAEEPLYREAPTADAPTAPAPAASPSNVYVVGAFGAFTDDHAGAGPSVDLLALARRGPLSIGLTGQAGAAVLDYEYISAAPAVGLFVPGPRWLDLGVVGVAGVRHYEGVGKGLLSADPGVSATLGYVGARVVTGVTLGTGPVRWNLGLQTFLDDDVTRETRSSSYQETPLFGGAPVARTSAHRIGALHAGVMLAFGSTFDL